MQTTSLVNTAQSVTGSAITCKVTGLQQQWCAALQGMQQRCFSVAYLIIGLRVKEEGAPLTHVGSRADEPIRAANACMGWGDSAPIRANSAVADLGLPVSMAGGDVMESSNQHTSTYNAAVQPCCLLVDRLA